jgi:hypothetical protein
MSTAIVKIHTADGFILAADGRGKSSATGITQSDIEQKIFPITNSGRVLAYALQGMTNSTDTKTQSIVFDIRTAIEESVRSLAETKSRHDLNWYASKLWAPVNEMLIKKINKLGDFVFPVVVADDPGLICQVFICGYYRNISSDSVIQFRHENHKVVRPSVLNFKPTIEPVMMFGSAEVFRLLFKGTDQRFQEFRSFAMTPDKRKHLSLDEGAEVATNYIRACASEVGREIDPEVCSGIGGHIHVAEITPSGFRWRIPPES